MCVGPGSWQRWSLPVLLLEDHLEGGDVSPGVPTNHTQHRGPLVVVFSESRGSEGSVSRLII